MKKAKSLFFYLLLIGTLNNINYIFSEDVEKPEWFQKLEELKNTCGANHEKWAKMFMILPQEVKDKIREKIYEPLPGTTIKRVAPPSPLQTSTIKIPGGAISELLKGFLIPIPNILDLLYKQLYPDQRYVTEDKNPTFATLALQVSESKHAILYTNLKKAWLAMLKDFSSSHNFENRAGLILLKELGSIIKNNVNDTITCVETIALSSCED